MLIILSVAGYLDLATLLYKFESEFNADQYVSETVNVEPEPAKMLMAIDRIRSWSLSSDVSSDSSSDQLSQLQDSWPPVGVFDYRKFKFLNYLFHHLHT